LYVLNNNRIAFWAFGRGSSLELGVRAGLGRPVTVCEGRQILGGGTGLMNK